MKAECPSCKRALYSRSRKTCGYCGAPIPEELRFDDERIETIQMELEEMERRRQMEKAKEEKNKKGDGGSDPSISVDFG